MKSECLPFRNIPHTTRLFADYLAWAPAVRPFYPRPPLLNSWVNEPDAVPDYSSDRRAKVSNILERQNKNWGASARTLENVQRLRQGAAAMVTGQQVGLFGGPLFALFKALTAVKLADEATSAGVNAVPVFWLATQDHDLAEVNSVSFPGPDATLRPFSVPLKAGEDAPVGTVRFGEEIQPVVEAAAELLGDSEAVSALRQAYQPGETFGSAFARLFARLFADWGVVLLDPADAAFGALAQPIYRAAIERAGEIDQALLAQGKELESAGYHQQVKVTHSSTLLFAVRAGKRTPIHRSADESTFLMGAEKISRDDLLGQIAAAPQDFSANVLLRPVVQDYLLPTVAYTGGAAETAYFAQAAVVYQALLGRVTPVIPRFSATLVEEKLQGLLERYGVAFQDLFHGAGAVKEKLAAKNLPKELQAAFAQIAQQMEQSLNVLRPLLERLDKTLVEAANNADSKIKHQLESLRSRKPGAPNCARPRCWDAMPSCLAIFFTRERLSRSGKSEASISWGATEQAFCGSLYSLIHTDCLDHQRVSL